MGMENFFRRIYENPEFVKILIENSTEWVIALVKEANHEDVDFILLGDDVADNSRPFISPKMFREFLLPEYKKIVESSDVPIIWHSDGNVIPLIPMIIEAGFAGIHSLEPKANIDLQIVKKEFGDKLVLSGNLDTTDVLCQSNLDIIREDVARCIRSGAPNGGYLFSSSNSLFKGHKVEAIQEAYKYVKEINQYPIDI
jgi:uroporphyrinogen decarboxylase